MSLSEKEEIVNSIKLLEENEIKKPLLPINYDYLEGLNEMQKIAATRLEGNFLVIAGPGAGKTHTLLYRVLHMVKMGIPGSEICIVTFTRKAANDLKRRIKNILPELEIGFVGTIHALAYFLISRSSTSNFRLIDPEDDRMILKLSMEEKSFKMPKATTIKTIQKIFDYSQITKKELEETLIDLNHENLDVESLKEIQNSYIEYKKQNGYMNYSDIILMSNGLNIKPLKYLMIDEYQDTDPIQIEMIKSLKFENVMAVGDDFQSIYSFRGADNKIILSFGKDFKNAKVIKLNINYRSTKEIVDMENIVTNATEYGYKKDLISFKGSSNYPVQWPDMEKDNSETILSKIIDQQKESDRATTAVIYRFNKEKFKIEGMLVQNKIDYVVYGGIKLLERKHIKDLCAILLTNKNKNDFIVHLRSLMLLEGVGEVSAKQLMMGKKKIHRKDFLKLNEIINHKYLNILHILHDTEEFYMSLESVLEKANYTKEEIQEDFNLLNELSANYNSINNFITDVILDGNKDKWSNKEKKSRVVLTTIHSSKGLEFDEVHFLYSAGIEYSIDDAEENRRLFYTAISRAKDKLFIYDSWGRNDINKIIGDFETEKSSFDTVIESSHINNNEPYNNETKGKNERQKPFLTDFEKEEFTVFAIQNEDKEILNEINKNWEEIVNNIDNSKHREMLRNSKVVAANESVLVLTSLESSNEEEWEIISSKLSELLKFITKNELTLTIHLTEKEFNKYKK